MQASLHLHKHSIPIVSRNLQKHQFSPILTNSPFSSMANEIPPFQLEVEEATRAYRERYDALKNEVKEYNGAQAEIKRLKVEFMELEQQLERTKEMIQVSAHPLHSPFARPGMSSSLPHMLPLQRFPIFESYTLPPPPKIEDNLFLVAGRVSFEISLPFVQAHTLLKQLVQAQENETKLKEDQIRPLLEFFKFPDNQRQPHKISNNEEPALGSTSTSTPITTVGTGPRLPDFSAGVPSPASALSSNVLTDKTLLGIIDDVERAHGHKFSLEEIKTIIEQYPHACFKDGELYLRQCSYCQANAIHPRNGSGAHFMQGNIAFIRHMRKHGFQSGLSGKSIDDHCDLGDPVDWEDVVLMSAKKEPKKPVVMNSSKGDRISKDFKTDSEYRNPSNYESRQIH